MNRLVIRRCGNAVRRSPAANRARNVPFSSTAYKEAQDEKSSVRKDLYDLLAPAHDPLSSSQDLNIEKETSPPTVTGNEVSTPVVRQTYNDTSLRSSGNKWAARRTCPQETQDSDAQVEYSKLRERKVVASPVGTEDIRSLGDTVENNPPMPPPRFRHLPLSPLMDEEAIEGVNRHAGLTPRAPEPENLTEFQIQLKKNPYARALNTPVRLCQVTKTALPKWFLQEFTMIQHLKTREPWFAPRNLLSPYLEGSAPDPDNKASESHESPKKPKTPSPWLGPTIYTLSRKALISAFEQKGDGYWKAWKRFSPRGPARGKSPPAHPDVYWRPDMDDLLLDLMRKRTVEGLYHLAHSKRGYLTPAADWVSARGHKQQGAILWTGRGSASQPVFAPPEFATYEAGWAWTKKSKLPVYNLEVLLGVKHLRKLKQMHPIFGEEIVMVKHKNMTVEDQLRLWKLQGYLAEHGASEVEVEVDNLTKEDGGKWGGRDYLM